MATGGTIASSGSRNPDGATAVFSAADLLSALPPSPELDIAPVVDLARVNSWNVDPPLMWRLAKQVGLLTQRPDVDGVVVTHGTDTLEEAAFLVDIVADTDKPVVFTAAMRSADSPSADGPHNLWAALRAASSPALHGLGAVACLDNHLLSARVLRKSHTHRGDAFNREGCPIATLGPDGIVRRTGNVPRRWCVPITRTVECLDPSDVPVVQAYTGMSGEVLEAVVATTGARGVIIDGFGVGNLPASLVDTIERLIRHGVVVVVSTRVAAGGTWPLYGGPGGGRMLQSMGVLDAGSLSAAKARLLLLVVLADSDRKEPRVSFAEAVMVLGRGTGG